MGVVRTLECVRLCRFELGSENLAASVSEGHELLGTQQLGQRPSLACGQRLPLCTYTGKGKGSGASSV